MTKTRASAVAWSLRKDDTQIREAFHIFPFIVISIDMILSSTFGH